MGRAFEVRKKSMMKTANEKSKVYARFGKEIYVAAKNGVPDPELNQNLKRIIEKAKKEQVPADVIKRNIEKAQGAGGENYATVRYEGFGPCNTLFIVDCLTDNVNRTISEVRNCFTKSNSKLGISGSVIHNFVYNAVFSFEGNNEEEILEVLIENECEVSDIELEDGIISIYAESTEYFKIKSALREKYPNLEFEVDEITFIPTTYVNVEGEDEIKYFEKLVNMLDDLDDVQNVYHNGVLE